VWSQTFGRVPGAVKRVQVRYAGDKGRKSTLVPIAALLGEEVASNEPRSTHAASSAQRCGAAAFLIPFPGPRRHRLAPARFRRIPLFRLSFFCALAPALWQAIILGGRALFPLWLGTWAGVGTLLGTGMSRFQMLTPQFPLFPLSGARA
jgi:hypothetical protein